MGTWGTVPKVPILIEVRMKIKGKIINIVSNIFYVEVNDKIYECTSRGIFKTKDLKPVVGDDVLIEVENEKGNILEIVDRTKYIKRPKMANLTQLILVVSSKNPVPDLLMLDKQLAFAELLGIDVLIVINKIDLEKEENIQKIFKIYSEIGYKVILTNAKTAQGVEELKKELKNNLSAFSGNSGVGKSTLLNGIFNASITEEGVVSQKNKRGKNITTSIKLFKLDEDTYIADTPGFGAFDIYEIEKENLYKYFKEFAPHEEMCEFVGCTHIKEEKCGIKQALEEGNISNSRYDNYVKIYNDLKDREEHKW